MKSQIKEDFLVTMLDIGDETYQGRISYDQIKIKNLAEDIKKFGQREPIGIRQKQEEKYQIIYGFQRVKALLLLKKETIKVSIYLNLTERECRELCIRDNEMHGDLTSIEKALQCKKLKAEGWSMEQLCESFNTKKSAIYNWLEVIKVDNVTLGLIHEGYLTIYQGLELKKQKDFSRRLEIIKNCLTLNWSVRDIRKWIKEGKATMTLPVNGWITLCPDGPSSFKSIEECKQCKWHVGMKNKDTFSYGFDGKKEYDRIIMCRGWENIKHTVAMNRFFAAWLRIPRKIFVEDEEFKKFKKLLPPIEYFASDQLYREIKEASILVDYLKNLTKV